METLELLILVRHLDHLINVSTVFIVFMQAT
jgi:hypothetical protein